MRSEITKLPFVCVASVGLLLTSCQSPQKAEPLKGSSEGAQALNVPARASDINEVARLLAGMQVSSGTQSAWPYHQRQMDMLWRRYSQGRGQKVRGWANQEIPDLQRYPALFYPFSGPDLIYAYDMFPNTQTYILCGLEPAEPLPDIRSLSEGEVAIGLNGLRTALDSIVNAGYFVTKDMRNDLQTTRLRGTLPILLAFLARKEARIESVDVVQLDASGTPVLAAVSSGAAPGLLIRFRSASGQKKQLYYFRQDLSNSGTKLGGPLLTFVANQGTPPALVKSASYLMHQSSFSNIRTYLTNSTPGIVQDPSGVPYQDLVKAGLKIDLYGNYQNTLNIFSQQQPDLRAAYRSGQHPVKSMDFGFGYLFNRSTTSIIVARRK